MNGPDFDSRRSELFESFSRESDAFFAASRLRNDGVILPRQTRDVVAICLSVFEQETTLRQKALLNEPVQANFRMWSARFGKLSLSNRLYFKKNMAFVVRPSIVASKPGKTANREIIVCVCTAPHPPLRLSVSVWMQQKNFWSLSVVVNGLFAPLGAPLII